MPKTFDTKVTTFAVRIPRKPGYKPFPGGSFTETYVNRSDAERRLNRCSDDCKLAVIPPFSR